MDNSIKIKLIIYSVISAFGFMNLVFIDNPGISVPVFAAIQVLLIIYMTKDRAEIKNKKALFLLIPVVILSLNFLISDSIRFKLNNILVIMILYSAMVLIITDALEYKSQNLYFVFQVLGTLFKPFTSFFVPFKWLGELKVSTKRGENSGRILLAIVITIPCIIFLVSMLASADMVFESSVNSMFSAIIDMISFELVFRIIIGTLVGLYLFGMFYIVFKKSTPNESDLVVVQNEIKLNPDLLIINVPLISMLLVYTIFIVIQFKYLFAGATLPDNFTYAEYARRGFFELLFLSFINVGAILVIQFIAKDKIYSSADKWGKVTKLGMLYLCAATVILLISSYYRMMMYNDGYGLTEMRLFVMIFLIFEGIGLLITFYYIIKPKFNVAVVYAVICLTFYLFVNVINMDKIIAKNNIDRYFEGKSFDIYYLCSLSADCADEMARLTTVTDDEEISLMTETYFTNVINDSYNSYNSSDWRSYNISTIRANKLYGGLYEKDN